MGSHELDVIAYLIQSTGEVKKYLPFIVNHENLNLTGIRSLLRKSKVYLRLFIPSYFLTHLKFSDLDAIVLYEVSNQKQT